MPSNGQFLHQTGSINPFPNTTEFQEEYSYHFPTHRPPPAAYWQRWSSPLLGRGAI